MAKVMTAKVKLQCPGGQATPAPPVGPALGQHGVNIGQFVTQFNDRTKDMKGTIIPVEITIYNDRTFEFITKSPPASVLLKQQAGVAAGADLVGGDELAQQIKAGTMNFDVALATPDMMGLVGPLGRILGPRGLMPSPRSGTVTTDIVGAVKEFKAGKIEFRNDKGGNVAAPVGKLNFSEEQLVENINAFLSHLRSLKPTAAKGAYIKTVTISATMSPGIRVLA